MTSKQKYSILLIGILLVFFIAYQFAIKNTINAYKSYTSLKAEKKTFDNAKNKVGFLEQQNSYLDSVLKSNEIVLDVSFQQVILNKVSKYVDEQQLKITSFNAPHVFEKKNITTYQLEVEGSFSKLLKFVNYFENQRLGKIASINFEKKKNYRTNKNYLRVTVYLQKTKK